MAVSVTMPRLGESVTEGTVTRWLKKEGERVEADEPLLEVSTDKVDTEIPSPSAGIVTSIKVQEDETVEVGVELAVIDESGTEGAAAPAAGGSAPAAGRRGSGGRLGGGGLRHPARPQARLRARRRPLHAAGHRCRRPHPQAGRPRRGGPGRRWSDRRARCTCRRAVTR